MAKTMNVAGINYEVIKSGTKRAKHLYKCFEYSINRYGGRTLWSCYTRPSYAKERAYNECVSWVRGFDDYDVWTVITYNTMMFTFGCIVYLEGKKYLMFITKAHNWLVEL